MTSQAARRADGSKPVVGSSRKISSGSPISASATSRRRRWPPESVLARSSACSREADQRERLVDVARRAVVAGVELEALAHGQARLGLGLLQHDPDPLAPRRWRAPRVGAEHLDLTGAGLAEALEDLDGRRLAGAVGPEEREDLAAADLEVDPADGLVVAVALVQRPDRDDRLAGRRPRLCPV